MINSCAFVIHRGGTVHRCHGSVCTLVQGSRFDTISVQHWEKNFIYYARFLLINFEQTVFFPPICENSKFDYIMSIILFIKSVLFSLRVYTNKNRPLSNDF